MAAVRELREETGLVGVIRRHLVSIDHPDRRAHYYLVDATSSSLRVGGPEADLQSPENHYSPEWITIASVTDEPIVPTEAAKIIQSAYCACRGASAWLPRERETQ